MYMYVNHAINQSVMLLKMMKKSHTKKDEKDYIEISSPCESDNSYNHVEQEI